jgi:hypothetical protein
MHKENALMGKGTKKLIIGGVIVLLVATIACGLALWLSNRDSMQTADYAQLQSSSKKLYASSLSLDSAVNTYLGKYDTEANKEAVDKQLADYQSKAKVVTADAKSLKSGKVKDAYDAFTDKSQQYQDFLAGYTADFGSVQSLAKQDCMTSTAMKSGDLSKVADVYTEQVKACTQVTAKLKQSKNSAIADWASAVNTYLAKRQQAITKFQEANKSAATATKEAIADINTFSTTAAPDASKQLLTTRTNIGLTKAVENLNKALNEQLSAN